MKRKIYFQSFVIFILSIFVISCNAGTEQGSGNITNHELPIDNYNQIKIDATLNLVYEAKPEQPAYLSIEGDDNLIPLIEVDIVNGKLEIKQKKNINPTKLIIYTNSPSLKSVETKGISGIHLKGAIAGDEFHYEQNGIGDLNAENLIFAKANFKQNGSGNFVLAGQVEEASYNLSGLGNFMAMNMQTNNLKCELKGNGYMQVNAQNELNIEIKGNGNVEYVGNAKLMKQEIKGVGTIKHIE